MRITVVDYGMGNLRSVAKALERVAPDEEVVVTSDPDVVHSSDRVVFPGQGAMPDCMREMDARGLRSAILDAARSKPFLGICIGLQMLFERSEEGDVAGLGLLEGNVRRFPRNRMVDAEGRKLKVPHMGWNMVRQTHTHPLWEGIDQNARFYFVHSYHVVANTNITAAETDYPTPFVSAVSVRNIFAVQFHPEKSHNAGLRLLSNFVSWKISDVGALDLSRQISA